MSSALQQALSIWHRALTHPIGVGIRTRDPRAARSLLYNARANSGIPQLNGIAIRTSPVNPSGELWLLRDPRAEHEAVSAVAPSSLNLSDLLPRSV